MSEIRKYVLVNLDDEEVDYEYDTLNEAKRAAKSNHAVVARVYVYEDAELVWTPNGANTWPPRT